jgi:cytochrome b6-f complex iron-sulfur subunit
MTSRFSRFVALSALCGLSLALLLVAVLQPAPHSLAYAGGLLLLIALTGWALELRATAIEETEAPFSLWPPVLAAGVTAVAGGVVLRWEYGSLLVALPLALVTGRAWLVAFAEQSAPSLALAPVPAGVLAAHAAAGDVIAIERWPNRAVSRRAVLRTGVSLSIGATVLAAFASVVDYLWERKPEAFGGIVRAGKVTEFPPGSKTKVQASRFWLVHLTAEQGGPGLLALWQKCPHLGCTVPWEEGFSFTNAETGESKKGWFRCPCHQSTYNDAGVRVYGPAPRSMDRFDLQVDPSTGQITVDTGKVTKGTADNTAFAVSAES